MQVHLDPCFMGSLSIALQCICLGRTK